MNIIYIRSVDACTTQNLCHIHTVIHSYILACMLAYLLACMLTYLLYFLAYLLACLVPCILTYLPTFLCVHIYIYMYICTYSTKCIYGTFSCILNIHRCGTPTMNLDHFPKGTPQVFHIYVSLPWGIKLFDLQPQADISTIEPSGLIIVVAKQPLFIILHSHS